MMANAPLLGLESGTLESFAAVSPTAMRQEALMQKYLHEHGLLRCNAGREELK